MEELIERLQIASSNAFEGVHKNAKKLEDALKTGDQAKIQRMDFSTEPMVCRFSLGLPSKRAQEAFAWC